MKQFFIKALPYLKNKYLITLVVFAAWILFFDKNSIFSQRKYYKKLSQLEQARDYYLKEIKKDKEAINAFSKPKNLEKFARERYLMKRDNEDIFIIVDKSTVNK